MRLSVYDAVLLGCGFAGGLLGWILAKQGWKVLLVDPGRQPRFAIGESSTPTADFLLAYLADRWNLPELAPLACWGTWKQHYPQLTCGKKRGFSYYRHQRCQPYTDDTDHNHSMLVAASSEDRFSDTHWLRSSVDQFFVQQAVACGATLLEESTASAGIYDASEKRWSIVIASGDVTLATHTRWLVDASGQGAATAKFVSNTSDDQWMRTRTRATFAHYRDVKPFAAGNSPDDPFCGDDAAQHHLFDEGWCWMLRMDNGVTSVGVVEKLGIQHGSQHLLHASDRATHDGIDLQATWDQYPSVAAMMADAQLVAPQGGAVSSGRLSRCRSRACGEGWVLLPNSYGFVDPLHSTGIAHTLSGVARIAEALTGRASQINGSLARYQAELRQEIRWLDTLVAGCYRAMPSFSRFTAFASLYFAAAVRFETAMAADPAAWPNGFLQCHDAALAEVAEQSFRLANEASINDQEFTRFVRQRIAPWNTVGLLDPSHKNRLHHTTAPKYARIL